MDSIAANSHKEGHIWHRGGSFPQVGSILWTTEGAELWLHMEKYVILEKKLEKRCRVMVTYGKICDFRKKN